MFSLRQRGDKMISSEAWDKAIIDSDKYYKKKNVRVTGVNGNVFEGICNAYDEDDSPNDEICWAINVGWRKFLQKDVEKIEFIDPQVGKAIPPVR